MLPLSYEIPAAVLLVLAGALACVAGYRLFRAVLVIYGFIFGALIASSVMGASNTIGMIVAALAGGVIGALVFLLGYLAGIALVGAGLGALVAHAGWSVWASTGAGAAAAADPPAAGVITLAVLGAVGAVFLQRYVIIVSTAFGGAWTLLVGGIAVADALAGRARSPEDGVWILYPLDPAPGERWVVAAWILIGLAGTAIQVRITSRTR